MTHVRTHHSAMSGAFDTNFSFGKTLCFNLLDGEKHIFELCACAFFDIALQQK